MFLGQGRYSNRPQRSRLSVDDNDDDPAYATWYELMEEAEDRRQVERRRLLNDAIRQLTSNYVVIPAVHAHEISDATNAAIVEMGGRVIHTAESELGDVFVDVFKTAFIIHGQTCMMTLCVKREDYTKRGLAGNLVVRFRSIVNSYASEYYTEEEGLALLNWVPRRIETSTVVYSPDVILDMASRF